MYGLKTNGIDPKIMKLIPKTMQHMIAAAWKDADGYWIELKDGFNAGGMDVSGAHTIHEETMAELRKQITRITVDWIAPPEIRIVETHINGQGGIYSVIYAGETIIECLGKEDVDGLTVEYIESLIKQIGGIV